MLADDVLGVPELLRCLPIAAGLAEIVRDRRVPQHVWRQEFEVSAMRLPLGGGSLGLGSLEADGFRAVFRSLNYLSFSIT